MLEAENQAVDPIHLKGREYGQNGGTGTPKYFKNVADCHIGTVRNAQIFLFYIQVICEYGKKTLRLRIGGKKFRGKLCLYCFSDFFWKPLWIFIHIQTQEIKASLTPADTLDLLYALFYIHNFLSFLW